MGSNFFRCLKGVPSYNNWLFRTFCPNCPKKAFVFFTFHGQRYETSKMILKFAASDNLKMFVKCLYAHACNFCLTIQFDFHKELPLKIKIKIT